MWEQTILPMVGTTLNALNGWLGTMFGEALRLEYDTEAISALSPKRDKVWERLRHADFLSEDEKRAAVGYGPREA